MGSTLSIALVVLVAVVGSVYQLILAPVIHVGGVFRKVDPLNNQNCQFVPELEGCEKMVHHLETGQVYLACSRIDGRPYWLPAVGLLNASGRPLNDHVATYDVSTGKIHRLQIEEHPNAARGLQVHGMDVVSSAADPSLLFVYLVNHRAPLVGDANVVGADSCIEIFSTRAGSSTLKHIATVEDPAIVTPNDIVGYPDGKSFYFTNDHAVKIGFSRVFEMYLNQASTTVGYCHIDHGCKIAARKLKGANGIVKSRTNDTIYVGSAHGDGVSVMDPQNDHTLLLSNIISTGGLPMDNLSIDKNNALWAAFFPRGFEVLDRYKNLSLKAASGAFRITMNFGHSAYFGEKYKVDRLFEDDGGVAMGSTSIVHLPEHKQLLIHGISAPHLAICKI